MGAVGEFLPRLSADNVNRLCCAESRTDDGNARRLTRRFGDRLRHHPGLGWLVYDGKRFVRDDSAALARARETARAIAPEASTLTSDDDKKQHLRWASASLSAKRIADMLRLAVSEPDIKVRDADVFDADPWMLNVQNGELDLRTAVLRPHRPESNLTQIAGVAWDPDADTTIWQSHVATVMRGDIHRIAYLQRLLGYILTGATREQIMAFWTGVGSNGKSLTVETVMAMLGDYALAASSELLLTKQRGAIPHDQAQLRGVRLAVCSEIDRGRMLAGATLKKLTGGDTINAHHKYGQPFTFKPVAKLLMLTNHLPDVPDHGYALWRRLHVLPFDVTFKSLEEAGEGDALKDPEIETLLRANLPGVLRWCVEGTRLWLAEGGLTAPEAVVTATKTYRHASDVAARFLADVAEVSATSTSTAKELDAARVTWCKDTGEPLSQKALSTHLATMKGLTKGRNSRGIFWSGLGLL